MQKNFILNINNEFCQLALVSTSKDKATRNNDVNRIVSSLYLNDSKNERIIIGESAAHHPGSFKDFFRNLGSQKHYKSKYSKREYRPDQLAFIFLKEISNKFKILPKDLLFIAIPDYFNNSEVEMMENILKKIGFLKFKLYKTTETIFLTNTPQDYSLSLAVYRNISILSLFKNNKSNFDLIDSHIISSINYENINVNINNNLLLPKIKKDYTLADSFRTLSTKILLNKHLMFYSDQIRQAFAAEQKIHIQSYFSIGKDDNGKDIKLDYNFNIDEFEKVIIPIFKRLFDKIKLFLVRNKIDFQTIKKLFLIGEGTNSHSLRRIIRQKYDFTIDWDNDENTTILKNLAILISKNAIQKTPSKNLSKQKSRSTKLKNHKKVDNNTPSSEISKQEKSNEKVSENSSKKDTIEKNGNKTDFNEIDVENPDNKENAEIENKILFKLDKAEKIKSAVEKKRKLIHEMKNSHILMSSSESKQKNSLEYEYPSITSSKNIINHPLDKKILSDSKEKNRKEKTIPEESTIIKNQKSVTASATQQKALTKEIELLEKSEKVKISEKNKNKEDYSFLKHKKSIEEIKDFEQLIQNCKENIIKYSVNNKDINIRLVYDISKNIDKYEENFKNFRNDKNELTKVKKRIFKIDNEINELLRQ